MISKKSNPEFQTGCNFAAQEKKRPQKIKGGNQPIKTPLPEYQVKRRLEKRGNQLLVNLACYE